MRLKTNCEKLEYCNTSLDKQYEHLIKLQIAFKENNIADLELLTSVNLTQGLVRISEILFEIHHKKYSELLSQIDNILDNENQTKNFSTENLSTLMFYKDLCKVSLELLSEILYDVKISPQINKQIFDVYLAQDKNLQKEYDMLLQKLKRIQSTIC